MTTIPRFRLPLTSAGPAESASTQMVLDFSGTGALAQSRPACGSFEYDRASGKFELQWGSLAEFDTWREDQERTYSIELQIARTKPAGTRFLWKRIYKCARKGSPDDSGYQKNFPIGSGNSHQSGLVATAKLKSKHILAQLWFWGIIFRNTTTLLT